MIEIIFNEQDERIELVYNGEVKAIVDLEQEYQNLLSQRDKNMVTQATNEIFNGVELIRRYLSKC